MSYNNAYYLAHFISALDKLALLACVGCLAAALYQFVRAHNLSNGQGKEEVRAITDWSSADRYVWRSKMLVFVAAPALYVARMMLPDAATAMEQLGFSQGTLCMEPGERGVLEASTSTNNVMYATFRLQNGVSIMCRIDDMNAAGTTYNSTYYVANGIRVSG